MNFHLIFHSIEVHSRRTREAFRPVQSPGGIEMVTFYRIEVDVYNQRPAPILAINSV